jgi:hypothetical protein
MHVRICMYVYVHTLNTHTLSHTLAHTNTLTHIYPMHRVKTLEHTLAHTHWHTNTLTHTSILFTGSRPSLCEHEECCHHMAPRAPI